MSWRATIACSRAQGEAVLDIDSFLGAAEPPVLVADEPDPSRPDDWLIHAYFEHCPTDAELDQLRALGSGEPQVVELGEADWVTMSQRGLGPIRAGRFFVHTPMHFRDRPADSINFEIDAGLAFGTGQHATTAGCLAALDRLESNGRTFANIADIGTGTGLLAFAAMALWPRAKCIATDIDPIAIDVSGGNAAINGVRLGMGAGELLLCVADGVDHPLIAARAPYDLLIANILAGPLVKMAPGFARALAPGGIIMLAGLLDTQAQAVVEAYAAKGLSLRERSGEDWPVLILQATGGIDLP